MNSDNKCLRDALHDIAIDKRTLDGPFLLSSDTQSYAHRDSEVDDWCDLFDGFDIDLDPAWFECKNRECKAVELALAEERDQEQIERIKLETYIIAEDQQQISSGAVNSFCEAELRRNLLAEQYAGIQAQIEKTAGFIKMHQSHITENTFYEKLNRLQTQRDTIISEMTDVCEIINSFFLLSEAPPPPLR